MHATHAFYATVGVCFGEESDNDSDRVDCILKLREKIFSSVEKKKKKGTS